MRPGRRLTAPDHRPLGPAGAATPRPPLTAFVLSGGASLGALQVGMLMALFDRGITADLLVGTSAGALNAAYIGSRAQSPATAESLAVAWRELRRESLFPASPRSVLGALTRGSDHLVPDRGLRRLIQRHLDFDKLEHARVPVHIIAFDVLSGHEVRLSRGPAVEAVLAACAIPGILPPVRIGARLLVDGGVVNNTPISHAIELGATRIYVLPSQDPAHSGASAPRNALDAAVRAVTQLVAGRLQGELERYGGEAELVVLPAVNPSEVQPTDFRHADRLIAAARLAAGQALARS